MSWRDEKADYLQKSRDFSFLHDDNDRGYRDVPRSNKKTVSDVPDNQETRDRLLRLRALEKQRADKQKKQYVGSLSPPERDDGYYYDRREMERTLPGPSGSKRSPPAKDNFGSFFGKVEKVVAKRVVDEKRAREIAAREAQAEKVAKARAAAESRNNGSTRNDGSMRNGSMRPPSSSSGTRPAAKPKPVNPVTVKAQKLKDNRDYSFLFSDEPPSYQDSRAEPSKVSKDVKGSSQKSVMGTQSQKANKAATSNGGLRPSLGQGSSQARKAGASSTSRPGSGGERDGGDARAEREQSRYYDSERRRERTTVPSSYRVASATKNERPSSTSKLLPLASDRGAKRDGQQQQERAKSVGPKATNHDRALVSRDSRVTTQTSAQRISSQSGNGSLRERMVSQKSTTTTDRRVSTQSVSQKGSVIDASKRKMVGEPAKKASINAKSNDGRRVERSRYEHSDSDSESKMRRLVAGGPRPGAASGVSRITPASSSGNGLKWKPSEELRKKPTLERRPMAEEPMRRKTGGNHEPLLPRKSSDELLRRSRPAAPAKVTQKRVRDLDSEYESEYESDDDRGRVRASGVSSIIQKMFRYNPNKYKDLDDEDDKNMETSFRHIQAEEKRSARLAREEDEREQELIEEEERQERLRKLKRHKSR